MNFDNAWVEAESTVFNALCKATGSVEGKQAFRGYIPPIVNAWALYTGGPGGNEQTTWAPDVVSVHIAARIEAAFAQRPHALVFSMQIVKALPILNSGNVQNFRIKMGGFPEPQADFVPVANEAKKVLAWTLNMQCELVFSTGGRL